ncbi:Transcription factor LuxR-like autoinducer-binding domain-containing protein [Dioscorea alata]|uniref:Transcription factor LuxR-like autoinducer-binding domain-containing protein n=1 Tax=Dioscorea alata TaxID=55571 RepID=A0ACB7VIB0_DIOAL|nr:Transcription factor LuxR-like autoinducer-binding domain-containing protein [Dioscorea alata]
MNVSKGMEQEKDSVMKTRSFRDEDYNIRRVFLRSYPLQWEEDEALDLEEEDEKEIMSDFKFGIRSKFIALIHWSEGKVVLLRRIKDKVAFYFVSCHSFGLKSPNKLITL